MTMRTIPVLGVDAPILETRSAQDGAAFSGLCTVIDRTLATSPDDLALVKLPDPSLPDNPTARITLAWLDGRPVGGIATWLVPGRTHGWVGSLCCDPAVRGRGLATALVEHAVLDRDAADAATNLLLATIRVLPSGELNLGSCRAFRASGFVAGARIRPRIEDFGQRARHWWPSANDDGTIDQLLVARLGCATSALRLP